MGYHDHRGHVASEEVKETKEDIEKAIVIVDSIIDSLTEKENKSELIKNSETNTK